MARKDKGLGKLPVIDPNLQISFYYRLQSLRKFYLHDALKNTVEKLDLKVLDEELNSLVPAEILNRVASHAIRGEIFFPVPCLLQANPYLLGYYRLLFGLSQKEFYRGPFGRFKNLEIEGDISEGLQAKVIELCTSLIQTGEKLVSLLDEISIDTVKELQLLTLGPQLRGSENVRIGKDATKEVFDFIKKLVGPYIKEYTKRTLIIENDSQRRVLIEFLSDPDIRITEKLESHIRPLVSIEIKGGTDTSNIHNRLGEAEKSHQNAKKRGFHEFWTIIRVDVDLGKAKRESPTTTHFFHIDRIRNLRSTENKTFKDMLASRLGIRM